MFFGKLCYISSFLLGNIRLAFFGTKYKASLLLEELNNLINLLELVFFCFLFVLLNCMKFIEFNFTKIINHFDNNHYEQSPYEGLA